MTTALRSNQTAALSAPGDALLVSARMSVFLAEELLPLAWGSLLAADPRGVILRNNPVPRAAAVGRQVSLRVCEMEAEVRVYLRNRSVPAEAVAAELQKVLAEKVREGVSVTRKVI